MAAVVASTASKINSIATIFTLDLYAKFRAIDSAVGDQAAKAAQEKHLVLIGRVSAAVATLLALVTARPLLGGSDQAFQFIQEFSGFFTPGITVIFLLGLFWKKASEAGAIGAAAASVVLSYVFKLLAPEIPFLDRMGIVFLAALAIAVVLSYVMPAAANADRISTDGVSYKTTAGFNTASVAVIAILVALYATWW